MTTTMLTTTKTKPQPGIPQDHAAQALYDQLIELLCAVAQSDAQALQQVDRFGRSLRFEHGQLYFTLPDLFAFCVARCSNEKSTPRVEYLTFRRFVYGQPTNAALRQRGCMVELAQPHAEHARSVYRLVVHRATE